MSSKKVKDQQYYDSKNRAAWNAVTANHRDGEESEHLAAFALDM